MRVIEITGKAIKGASCNWSNFGPLKFTWQQLARDQDEPAPYAYMDQVRVVWDAVTVMEGTIRKCALEQSGNAWRWSIEACDILQPLEGALCFSPSGGLRGALNANISGGSAESVPRRVGIAATLKAVLEDARMHGLLSADVGIDVSVSASAWMWDTALSCDMYAGVLRKVLASRPGMVCRVDYTGDAPVIRVADGADLPVTTLDRVRDRLSSIKLTPRPDLVPPAVGVVLTAGNQAYQSQVWPRGASLHQEGCVTVQVAVSPDSPDDDEPQGSESPVWDFTKPVVEVTGHKLPTNDVEGAIYWRRKIPQLATLTAARYGRIKKSVIAGVDGSTQSNYSTDDSAQRYEHVSGQLSESCNTIKWCYVELKQYVYMDAKPPKGCEMLFPHTKQVNGVTRYYHWMTWRGRTINTMHRKYRASKSGDAGADGGGEPPISGGGTPPAGQAWPDYTSILRDYYEVTRDVPVEGSVTALRAVSPAILVGSRLAITGSRREYRDMATVVQSVSVDLDGESTAVTTGVPAHLSLQDMIDRMRQIADDQQALDDQDQVDGPVQTLQYDSEAYKSPPAPTLGPEGEIVWSAAPEQPPIYGLQVILDWDDDNANVTGARMRRGKLMLQGVYISQTPGDNSGWYTMTGFTAGEIWLDVKFNAKGKLTGTSIAYEQGPVNPLRLQDEEPDESEEFFYSFHVATVQDKVVYQHMLGTIQIPVNYGTFYPYGPAV